jgi:response regulator RpfG family c-di-GMP phosphodiesterase
VKRVVEFVPPQFSSTRTVSRLLPPSMISCPTCRGAADYTSVIRTAGGTVKVLIANDDIIDVAILRQLVERLPQCHAIEFARAELALSWCRNNETDLVIVKHLMPGFDGIQFTRQLRRFAPKTEVPLLMLTVIDDPRSARKRSKGARIRF